MLSSATDVAPRRRHDRRRAVTVLLVALGFASAIAQLTLTREIIGTFGGNELTIGITLSCWLLLTALGTWWGSLARHLHRPVRLLAIGVLVAALLAIPEVLLVRVGRPVLFMSGAAVDPIGVGLVALVVLAPFCFASGALLSIASYTLLLEGAEAAIGRVYAADAAGSIAGAALFTWGFSSRVDHVATLCGAAALVAVVTALIGWRRRARTLAVVSVAAALVLPAVARWAGLDAWSTQWQYRSPVVHRASSPYGRLVVTHAAGQWTFYENGQPAAYTANAIETEETVHYAMAQRPRATEVLLIGGAVAGAAREVLRYPAVVRVTAVEIDPSILAAGRRFLPENLADARLHLVVGDGRRLVQASAGAFDVIIVSLPDPTTYQLNRYYTVEFLAAAHRALRPDGVVAFSCGRYENFISAELGPLLASARASVAQTFAHVQVLTGARVGFLGSDGPLHRDIAGALDDAGVHPAFVNRHSLEATLAEDRLAEVDRASALPAVTNRDFHPILYLLRLRQWLAQFAFPAGSLALLLLVVFTFHLVRLRAVPRLIFAAGFAGAALEIALLAALQTFYGALYGRIGAVVGTFMLGLALGATAAMRTPIDAPRRVVGGFGFAIAALAGALPLVLPRLAALDAWLHFPAGQLVILGLTLLLAALMGAQFAAGAAESTTFTARTAPRIFSADLVGAALGGLATSAYLLPAFGLTAVCLATAGLNLLAAGLSWARPGNA